MSSGVQCYGITDHAPRTEDKGGSAERKNYDAGSQYEELLRKSKK